MTIVISMRPWVIYFDVIVYCILNYKTCNSDSAAYSYSPESSLTLPELAHIGDSNAPQVVIFVSQ